MTRRKPTIRNCEHCHKPYPWWSTGNTRHCSAACRSEHSLLPIGSTHYWWTVLANHELNARRRRMVTVQCICGVIRKVQAGGLKLGKTRSCGCLKKITNGRATTHGKSYTAEWYIYHAAKGRCNNPNNTRFADYGGRGIEFRFTSFEQFEAELGPRPTPTHSINRIDNDGHYEVGNVEWATDAEQRKNKRRNGPRPRLPDG